MPMDARCRPARSVTPSSGTEDDPGPDAIIQRQALLKRFGEVEAVRDVSLGRVSWAIGYLGMNGARQDEHGPVPDVSSHPPPLENGWFLKAT